MGAFIMGATVGAIVCSGTGYYYPPYVYHGYYYPYAATYGYRAYNPYTGAYGYGGAAYGPYGSAHWGTSYNPNTGTYARGATPRRLTGRTAVGEAYNPYTGSLRRDPPGSNAYGFVGTIGCELRTETRPIPNMPPTRMVRPGTCADDGRR